MSVNFEFISDRLRNQSIKLKEEDIDEEVTDSHTIMQLEQSSGEDMPVSDVITSDHDYGQDMVTDGTFAAPKLVTPSVSSSSAVTAIAKIDELLSNNESLVEQVSKVSPWSNNSAQAHLDNDNGTCTSQQGANKANLTKAVGSVISPRICPNEEVSSCSKQTTVNMIVKSCITATNANRFESSASKSLLLGKVDGNKMIILNQSAKDGEKKEHKILIKALRCSLKGCSKVFLNQTQVMQHLKSDHNMGGAKLSIKTCGTTTIQSRPGPLKSPITLQTNDSRKKPKTISLRQLSPKPAQVISVKPSLSLQRSQLTVQGLPQIILRAVPFHSDRNNSQSHNTGPTTSLRTADSIGQGSPSIVKPTGLDASISNYCLPGANNREQPTAVQPISFVPTCSPNSVPIVKVSPITLTAVPLEPIDGPNKASKALKPPIVRSLADIQAKYRTRQRSDNTILKPTISRGCAIDVQLKEAIIRLKDYFERKYPNWSDTRVVEEISDALKVSEQSIWRIIKYFQEHKTFKEPTKHKRRDMKYICSDEDRDIMEKCIHKLKDENRLTSIGDIFKELRVSDQFNISFKGCSRSTFHKIFKESGFRITDTMIVNLKPSVARTGQRVDGSTGNGKYECAWPECGKTFVKREYYINHERTHTQVKPYGCRQPGCYYKCATLGNFNKHLKVHGLTNNRSISIDSFNDS